MPRRPLIRPLALLLAVLAAAPAGTAQENVRVPTFVRVVDLAGKPIAGAEVTFAGGHPHLGASAGIDDVQTVASDARGRAQAKLQPGLCYVAWAIGPRGGDDEPQWVSAVAPWFGAGALLTLVGSEARSPRQLPLRGEAKWQALGPLRCMLRTPGPGLEVELALRDGEVTLPVGPFEHLEVRTNDGQPLWLARCDVDELALPPPQTLVVRVVDGNGAPIAGAAVRQRVARLPMWNTDGGRTVVDDRWRELGTTDADGRCAVLVAFAGDLRQRPRDGDLFLFVQAPGRPEVCGGLFRGALYASDERVARIDGDELRFVVPEPAPLVGNLGLLPRGTKAHLDVVAKLDHGAGNYHHDARSYRADVAADGTFRFDAVPRDLHSSRLVLQPPPGSSFGLSSFASLPGRELPTLAPPSDAANAAATTAADGLGELTVAAVEPSGGPARGLVVFLAPSDGGTLLVRDSLFRFPLDLRGEALLRLGRGAWSLVAIGDGTFATGAVEVGGVVRAGLQLQPMARARLELHDERQQPIAGARVVACGATMQGQNDPMQAVLQVVRRRWMAGWEALRTDAAGRVEVPFVPVVGVTQRVQLEWPDGKTAPVELADGGDWLVVRPR
ncbi:MAG: hypothetical protein ACK5UQ_07780 [Planctomycetota bacterium]